MLVPLGGGAEGTRWLLLDRATLGDAVGVEALPALDGTRALGQLTVAGAGGVIVRRTRQVVVTDARRARPGPDPGRGRERGDRPLVPRDGLGVRQGPGPVRPPIGQFQAVKHALADMLVAVEQCAAVAWDAAAAWSEDADVAGDERAIAT